ncbi:hypothetical protein DQQ10_18050 [Pseudochryseolinea flava]|uniref:Uncharacterized protein n=2 Tax=Pseudochryseolinea flava TaxID=2059302 RepID=A0A364XYY2_9BACT|nr:hypothetical protein DQQ10_18050 [Pseudochryseolinea flava]
MLVATACKKQSTPEHALNAKEYKSLRFLTDTLGVPNVHQKIILAIPSRGCASCIEAAMKYAKQNEGEPKITIIITGASSKFTRALAKKYQLDENRFVVDTKGMFLSKGLVTIYPTIFKPVDDYTMATHLDATNIRDELGKIGIEFTE